MQPIKLIKISADGKELPDDAADHVAVLLPDHGLTFTATSVALKDAPHEQCEAACKSCTLLDAKDWDMPTIEELALLVERGRYQPAINSDYFTNIQDGWYWSKTPTVWSPSSVWVAHLNVGDISYHPRNGSGFALAVRRSALAAE